MPRLFILLLLSAFPQLSLAQQGLVACQGTDCNYCELVTTINNVLEFIIMILVLVAVMLMVYAGFKLVTSAGDSSAVSEGKKLFTNVIIGFIIILASWVLVDTVLKALVNPAEVNIGRVWEPIDCGGMTPARALSGYTVNNETAMDELLTYNEFGDPIGLVGSGTGVTIAEAEALAKLQASGISLKEGASILGIQSHVIDRVIALNQSCNCNVLITEGTGGTHASGVYSHANGYKLDLRTRDNPDLVNYVKTLPSGGSWSDGTPVYIDQANCAKYAIESDHIDVQYLPSC